MGKTQLVTIFGGTGFVGRHLVQHLAKKGYLIRVACRHPERAGFLQPVGGVSQITSVYANLRNDHSIKEAVKGADYVVNLVGILAPSGTQRFANIHVQGARLVAIAAREAGAKQLVHVSALGADANSNARYARTKAHGEEAVLNLEPNAIILRPSVIFGPEDEFFNRFAGLMSSSPVVPVFAGNVKFQPVYVGDVVEAIIAALEGKGRPGTIYELGGPQTLSMKEVHNEIKDMTGLNPLLLPMPLLVARLIALATYILPKAPITFDQIKLLKKDNIVSQKAMGENRALKSLSPVTPRTIRAIVPHYLDRFASRTHLTKAKQ